MKVHYLTSCYSGVATDKADEVTCIRCRNKLPKIVDGYAFVPVSNTYAKIDVKDIPLVCAYKWRLESERKMIYARTGSTHGKKNLFMHNLVSGTCRVDHRDSDGLNNTRKNLRCSTVAENARNSRKLKPASSKYKGVHLSYGRWRAKIQVDKVQINLGAFSTEEEAAIAYNNAASKHFGSFARLNVLEQERKAA